MKKEEGGCGERRNHLRFIQRPRDAGNCLCRHFDRFDFWNGQLACVRSVQKWPEC